MKYVSQGPMLLDVHMHRPNTNSKNFMDALLAFWPGLQVSLSNSNCPLGNYKNMYTRKSGKKSEGLFSPETGNKRGASVSAARNYDHVKYLPVHPYRSQLV